MNPGDFSFKAIGTLLQAGRLRVPAHQRDYSWEVEHVEDLCKDFFEAVRKDESYFLGTIVLTKGEQEILRVVDGQQRLATTTIIASVIRDIFFNRGDEQMVTSTENDFIFRIDRATEEKRPKLFLNKSDNELFKTQVLLSPDDELRGSSPATAAPSNKKLMEAVGAVRTFLNAKVAEMPSPKDHLKAWLNLIEYKAMVIVLTVASDRNAHQMFETLNDRGLKVSQADLVKNYVFGLVDSDRQREVQDKWSSMISLLEYIGEKDAAIDYLRFVCSMFYGLTTRGEVFDRVKDHVAAQQGAIQFTFQIENLASDYAAILSPDHPKWNEYPSSIRRSLRTLAWFEVTQIRHLMLAVGHHFSKKEAAGAYRMFVDWIVRLFIAASGKVGRLEANYSALAHEIHTTKNVKTAAHLFDAMQKHIPNDDEFRQAFAVAKVSQGKLARYYLDALERHQGSDTEADLVPNDDTSEVNLEHVIPRNWKAEQWPNLDKETAESLYSRLGNLALLNAKKNAKIGDFGFAEKKGALSASGFSLTQSIAAFDQWGVDEVSKRQQSLAEIAVETWPLRR